MLPSDLSARERLELVIEGYEQAWQAGARPAIEDYLSDTALDRLVLLRELVHTDLEYRLRAGDALLVEEYLERFPELADDADELIELIVAEYRHRRYLGQQPMPAEYLERFPQHRERLLLTPLGDAATEITPKTDGVPSGSLPESIGRYRVDQFLAKGGMGEVWRVLDGDFDRPLALKVLQEQYRGRTDLEERFLREARLTGQLQHPGIPPVQQMGLLPDGRPYFIMKLVKGQSLRQLLRQRATPQERKSYYLGIFEQICRTVAYAHACGILHRDLKPGNVMVGAFGEVQVMDWGLAKVLHSGRANGAAEAAVVPSSTVLHVRSQEVPDEASEAGDVLGTPAYMAPEQARGEVEQLDARSDVFGLGGILCDILTGQPPFAAGSNLENQRRSMKGDLSEAFARLDGCGADAELISLAKRCLAPERGDRPADADAVASAAAAYQERVRERLRQAEVAKAEAEVRAEERLRQAELERKATEELAQARLFQAELKQHAAEERAVAERKRRRLHLALAASVMVLLTLAAAGGWWVLQQQAEQEREELLRAEKKREDELIRREEKKHEEQRTRKAVEGALQQVPTLQAKGLWPQATSLLEQALRLLGPAGDAQLTQQVKTAQRNLRVVARLDRIRQEKSLIVEGEMNYAGAPAQYAAAFKEYGLDVKTGEEDVVVRQLANSAVRDYLVAALDDWLIVEANQELRERLCRLTANVTGQPWRVELAAALDDLEQLEALLARVPPAELTVGIIAPLGWTIESLGGDGVVLLEGAKLRHPTDFWVWFELGNAYLDRGKEYANQAAGAFGACLAIRPESAVAWNNLGNRLFDKGDLVGAIAAFNEAIRLDPELAYAHNGVGNVLFSKRDLAGAIAAYKEAIRADRKAAIPHNNLGNVFYVQGDVAEAIAAYQEAIRLGPNYAMPHYNLGIMFEAQGDLVGAIAAYQEAIRRDPRDAKTHFNLGNALHDHGDLRGAIAAYQEAIRRDPKDAKTHFNLGNALRKQGELPAAIVAYKEAIRLDPKFALAHNGLGLVLHAQGDVAKAIAAYQEAIRLDRKYATPHNNLGSVLAGQGKVAEAIAAYKEAMRLDPKDASPHYNLGTLLVGQGQVAEAIAAFKEAIRLDPKDASSHHNLGSAFYQQGKVAEAIVALKEAIRLDPKHASSHCNLGIAYHNKGKLAEAITSYQEAIRLDPNYAKAHYNLGNALRDQGSVVAAIAAYKEAIRIDPKDIAAHSNMGSVLAGQGKLAEAIAAFKEAIRIDPKDAYVRYNLGNALRAQGRLDDAITAFKEAIRLNPKYAEAHANLCVALGSTQRYRESFHAFQAAFVANPKLTTDPKKRLRLLGAVAGVLAAAGKGKDALSLTPDDKSTMRQQALAWLKADLAAWDNLLQLKANNASLIQSTLKFWKKAGDFASVRDEQELLKLPRRQRPAWRQLWADVDTLLGQAEIALKGKQ
jgi:tetratricopeptide (TPR) repeat protein/serine/threonine protein kinase